MNDIYKKLYDAALEKCDNEHMGEFEVYDAFSKNNPLEINIYELMKIKTSSNLSFIKIAYIAILNRPIDNKALIEWEKKSSSMSEKDFRELAINKLVNSEEASNTGKIYKDNIVSNEDIMKNIVKQSGIFLQVARKTYQKMPEPIKDAVRKMRGVES